MRQFNPDEIYERLRLAGEEWTDKDAAANALEFAADTMLSKCFLEADGSIEERKHKARVDTQYQDAKRWAIEARKAALKAKVKYDTGRVLAELRRTQESTRRAELNA